MTLYTTRRENKNMYSLAQHRRAKCSQSKQKNIPCNVNVNESFIVAQCFSIHTVIWFHFISVRAYDDTHFKLKQCHRMRMNGKVEKKKKPTFFDMYLIKNYTCYNLDRASLDRYIGRFMCAVLAFCYRFILFALAHTRLLSCSLVRRWCVCSTLSLICWRFLINYSVFFNIRNWSNAIDQTEQKI